MKKRSISIRVPYDVLAQCYDINERAGVETKNLAMSAASSKAIEILMTILESMGMVSVYTEEAAEMRISGLIGKKESWVGFEIDEDVMRKHIEMLGSDMKRDTGRVTIVGPPISSITEELTPDEQLKCEQVAEQEDRSKAIEATLQSYAEDVIEEQETELLKAVKVPSVYRESEDEAPETDQSRPPWVGSLAVDEDLLKGGPDYNEAREKGPLHVLALRIVYASLPQSSWGTDQSKGLVDNVATQFKLWEAKNEKTDSGK